MELVEGTKVCRQYDQVNTENEHETGINITAAGIMGTLYLVNRKYVLEK